MSKICPVCNCGKFRPYNGRQDAQCAECKSLERGRAVWLVLRALDILKPGMRVMHCAPELFLAGGISPIVGELYYACDLEPGRYRLPTGGVVQLDLAHELNKLPSQCFDLILHNHVLEHVPISVFVLLDELWRVLAPGGHHVFTVPFRGDLTDEDLSPNLGSEERIRRFGQADHLRIFGRQDFPAMLHEKYGVDPVFPLLRYYSASDLSTFGVSLSGQVCGETVFHLRKPGVKQGTV